MNRREAIAALVALPAVARLSAAPLKPSDVIVVECDERLSVEAGHRIKETVEKIWPGHQVIIFDKGVRMKLVGAGKAGA